MHMEMCSYRFQLTVLRICNFLITSLILLSGLFANGNQLFLQYSDEDRKKRAKAGSDWKWIRRDGTSRMSTNTRLPSDFCEVVRRAWKEDRNLTSCLFVRLGVRLLMIAGAQIPAGNQLYLLQKQDGFSEKWISVAVLVVFTKMLDFVISVYWIVGKGGNSHSMFVDANEWSISLAFILFNFYIGNRWYHYTITIYVELLCLGAVCVALWGWKQVLKRRDKAPRPRMEEPVCTFNASEVESESDVSVCSSRLDF